MKDVKLDLSKFKHVKTDGFQTTLKHKDGHTISLAHHALSESTQKQLQALGGSAKAAQTPLQADEAHDQAKMAYGGEAKQRGVHTTGTNRSEKGHEEGVSRMGRAVREGDMRAAKIDAKNTHHNSQHINPKLQGLAKGGKVEPKPKAQPQEPMQKPSVKKHEDPRYGSTTVIDNEDKRVGTVRQKLAHGALVEENPDLQDDSVDQALNAMDDGQHRQVSDYTQDPYNAVDAITTRLPSSPNIDRAAKPQYQLQANDLAQDGLSPKKDDASQPEDHQSMVDAAQRQPMQQASMSMPTAGGVSAPAPPPGEEVSGAAPQQSEAPQQGMPDMGNLINQGYGHAMRGAELGSQAEQGFGQATSKIQGDAAEKSLEAQQLFHNSYNETLQELHDHMQDVKDGQIDPDKYWTGDKDGNGSHSRVMAGIGMILAGFNPTSNPNAAINYIQHQIDKSVEAQGKNLESKQNLVRANLEQFHNLKDATEMARLQQADVVNHYMDQAMANAKTPMAKAALENAKSQIAQTYAPLAMQLSLRHTLDKLVATNNPDAIGSALNQMQSMPGGAEMAKPYVERYVPGVGMGTIPVPGAVREQITSQQKLQSAAQDLLAYSKGHTNIIPGTAAYNTGVQKAAIVQQMVREGMLGTVFRESEKPLLNQFVNHNPAGAFKAMSTDPKLRTLIESNEAQLNTLKSNYGLPTSHGAADANKSGPVKGKDGKMYQLDPSGKYYIPVGK